MGRITQISDNFPGASLSANWTTIAGGFTVASGQVSGTNAAENTAAYSGTALANDQWAQVIVAVAGSSTPFMGAAARCSSVANTHYEFSVGTGGSELGNWFLVSVVSNGRTTLQSGNLGTVNVGDAISLECVGTQITGKYNGTIIANVSDSSIASGFAGMTEFTNDGQALQNFTAGIFGSGGVANSLMMMGAGI